MRIRQEHFQNFQARGCTLVDHQLARQESSGNVPAVVKAADPDNLPLRSLHVYGKHRKMSGHNCPEFISENSFGVFPSKNSVGIKTPEYTLFLRTNLHVLVVKSFGNLSKRKLNCHYLNSSSLSEVLHILIWEPQSLFTLQM